MTPNQNLGWECPKCGRCFAPRIDECTSCNESYDWLQPHPFVPPYNPWTYPYLPYTTFTKWVGTSDSTCIPYWQQTEEATTGTVEVDVEDLRNDPNISFTVDPECIASGAGTGNCFGGTFQGEFGEIKASPHRCVEPGGCKSGDCSGDVDKWFKQVVEDARQKTENRPVSRRSQDVNDAHKDLKKRRCYGCHDTICTCGP